MTLVKICGVRDAGMALEVAQAGADFIGLVFAESKRKVTPQQTYDIVEALKGRRTQGRDARFDGPERGDVSAAGWFGAWADAIDQAAARWRPLIVGVFADMSAEDVNSISEAAGLDIVQLSGGEGAEFAAEIRRPVVRALHVGPGTTLADLQDGSAPGSCAGLLLDTASAGARGGTGETFDWGVAAEFAERTPFMLAGGLNPENVASAVAGVHPWAVDVSSGVETDGQKDIAKVRAFIRAAKG